MHVLPGSSTLKYPFPRVRDSNLTQCITVLIEAHEHTSQVAHKSTKGGLHQCRLTLNLGQI